MNIIIWPQYCEYKKWGYKKYQDGHCVFVLPVGDKIQGYTGTEKEIKDAVDTLCMAESYGLDPERIGLNTKLAEEKLGQQDS